MRQNYINRFELGSAKKDFAKNLPYPNPNLVCY